jgi:hypothetical protein
VNSIQNIVQPSESMLDSVAIQDPRNLFKPSIHKKPKLAQSSLFQPVLNGTMIDFTSKKRRGFN